MGLSRTDGGLYVPEGAHEAAVMRALREHDDDLRLVPQDSDHFGRRVYKVFRYAGSERPAEFLLFWGDEHGNPFPLSSSLVDAVKQLDRNMRGFDPRNADAKNAELVARRRQKSREDGEALLQDYDGRLEGKKSSPPKRSVGLLRARDRVRARTRSSDLRP